MENWLAGASEQAERSANIGRLGDGKQVVFSPPGEGARV